MLCSLILFMSVRRWLRKRTGTGKHLKACVDHAERLEDVCESIVVETFAGDFFYDGSEGDEVDVGVFEGEARWPVEGGVHGAADAFGLVGCGEAPGVFEGDVFGQAGVVGEKLADSD